MSAENPSAEPQLPLFRISVERYHAMRDAGILGEDDNVELLAGLLIPKMTKKPTHRLATRLARQEIEAVVPKGYYVDTQEPVTTPDSEPEPDVAIVRGAPRDYSDRHPHAADVALVVEIADDSLHRDRGLKLDLYARARIPVYWIVDLRDRTVTVYTEPDSRTYRSHVAYDSASEVPLVIDGREVPRLNVADLLP